MSAKTQQQSLLRFLKERGDRGVYVWEMLAPQPQGVGIAQYNARIYELRDQGFNIVNTEPGHFKLVHDNQSNVKTSHFCSTNSDLEVLQKPLIPLEEKVRVLESKIQEVTQQIENGATGKRKDRLTIDFKLFSTQLNLLKRCNPDQFINQLQGAFL